MVFGNPDSKYQQRETKELEREVCRGGVAPTASELTSLNGFPSHFPHAVTNLSFVGEEDSTTLREEDTAHS